MFDKDSINDFFDGLSCYEGTSAALAYFVCRAEQVGHTQGRLTSYLNGGAKHLGLVSGLLGDFALASIVAIEHNQPESLLATYALGVLGVKVGINVLAGIGELVERAPAVYSTYLFPSDD